jgi:hypothetical protein
MESDMFLSKKHISRRTVLKGVGATIALPLLDAMNPAATAWAATPAGAAPKRIAFIGFPHGAIMDRWSPKQTGADYEMSEILKPLAPFRQHMTVVSRNNMKLDFRIDSRNPVDYNECLTYGYIEAVNDGELL